MDMVMIWVQFCRAGKKEDPQQPSFLPEGMEATQSPAHYSPILQPHKVEKEREEKKKIVYHN